MCGLLQLGGGFQYPVAACAVEPGFRWCGAAAEMPVVLSRRDDGHKEVYRGLCCSLWCGTQARFVTQMR